MVNWEFFDNQTPAKAVDLVDKLRQGKPVGPTRGPSRYPLSSKTSTYWLVLKTAW